MNRIATLWLALLLPFAGIAQAPAPCSELFFSEYLEGLSNNKAIEIFNPSSATVSLADYVIYRYNNGSPTATDSLLMQGPLAPGAVFVAGNPTAVAAILAVSDTLHTITFFNGDDALLLKNKVTGDTLDIIGIIGNDPGVNWPVGTGATSEFTLVRQSNVQAGTLSWALGATQWDVYPQDATSFLGAHVMLPCGSVTPANEVSFAAAGYSVPEAAGQVNVSLTIAPAAASCSVKVSLLPGSTATEGTDFTFSSPDTVVFASGGPTSLTLSIPILLDPAAEGNETFTLAIDSLSGCAVGAVPNTTVTILDSAQQQPPSGPAPCSAPFFSEYLEGSGNNKALEIYNPTDLPVNLRNYQIRRFNNGGLTPVIFRPSGMLMPGAVYVIGNPSGNAAILAASDTTGDATFFNGDDALALIDTVSADTVDIIGIIGNDPGTNWPVGTGATSEFTLVRKATVQAGTLDWAIGATQWNVFPVDFTDSLGTHFAVSCDTVVVVPTLVNFVQAQVTVAESGGPASVSLSISPAAADCSVLVSLQAGNTATPVQDFTFSSPDTVVFASGGPATLALNIPIVNDADVEGPEFFVLRLDSLSGCGIISTNDTVRITITDDDVPLPVYPIGLITADANGDGIGDSLNVRCEVRGVVYGVDLRGGNGVQFTLRDAAHGIGVFTTSATVGYTQVTQGDSLHVIGRVEQFNGLTQMGTLDTIIVAAAGRPIQAPVLVDSLGESTESEYIRIECVKLVNPAQWTGTGSGFTAQITDGTNTFDLRIDNDVALYSQPAPQGYFNVNGIGGQFDSSVPRTSGYQILPSFLSDIVPVPQPMVTFVPAALSVPEQNTTVAVPLSFMNLNPDSTEVWVYLAANSTATQGADFVFANDTLYQSGFCGTRLSDTVSVQILDDQVLEGNETVVLYIAAVVNGQIGGVDTVVITIEDNSTDAAGDLLPAAAISLYPNPGRGQIILESSLLMDEVRMLDLSGREVLRREVSSFRSELPAAQLPGGVYLVEVRTQQGRWMQKWIKAQP
ncbi:MAG: Calx-beta domain-containing protein [Bacteroidia bacterium]|nr:Calx-beta domain-containing protein [Bacteroidia bacterium]